MASTDVGAGSAQPAAVAPSDQPTRATHASDQAPACRPPPSTNREAQATPSSLQRWRDQLAPGLPDPWAQRKLAIFIVFGLAAWTFYVVVGRVCAPMVQEESDAHMGRAAGIGTMCAFVVLWLMFLWNYIAIITVSPGFAVDYVPKCTPPVPRSEAIEGDGLRPAAQAVPQLSHADSSSATQTSERLPTSRAVSEREAPSPSELAPAERLLAGSLPSITSPPQARTSHNANHAIPPTFTPAGAADHDNAANTSKQRAPKDPREVVRPVPPVEPGPRWCRFCEIMKPDRTHHCRHCGTCVLQYDHHCLWIGQCVGWANHKHFITFNFWAGLFSLYTFLLLIVDASRASRVDGEVVAIIVLTGWFTIFTLMTMLPQQLYLILTGKTTLESFRGQDQAEVENALLSHEYGWRRLKQRRQVRRLWKAEWGGSQVDERWRWGTTGDMWRQEMGEWWPGWILPLGRPPGDGLHYRQNARFGPNGEWLRKSDWPAAGSKA